jgi:DNA-binding LacI/PurR family transcriptional regulator
MVSRITIVDVARRAGVSKGAASHALNELPGVSEETRARVKAAAVELGWSPNGVARALSGSRAGAIGWAIVRSAKSSTIDPYFTELFAGIEVELAQTDVALVVKLVADRDQEEALYRRWAAERRVDGVLVTDVDVNDRRFGLLDELGLPAVAFRSFVGEAPVPDSLPSVWFAEQPVVNSVLDLAARTGHRRVGWISGDPAKLAVTLRERAALDWSARTGITVSTAFTDYSTSEGTSAAAAMLGLVERPTFLVFDNDMMAMAGLSTCHALGLRVPDDVSVASFIDTDLCSVAVPPITALRHSTVDSGEIFTHRLLNLLASGSGDDQLLPPLRLIERASTGPAPA